MIKIIAKGVFNIYLDDILTLLNKKAMFIDIDNKEAQYILEHNYLGHLGYTHLNRPYVVPITYYFDKEQHAIICYSGQGHKLNAMQKNSSVCLQVEEIKTLTNWKSILVHGNFVQNTRSTAKANLHKFSLGVKDVVLEREHKKVDFIHEFSSKIYKDAVPHVFIIKIEEITGKKRITF